MGLLDRLVRRRPDAEHVTAEVSAAVSGVGGVGAVDLLYNHQQYRGGALSGTVEVADSTTFLAVLRVAHARLGELLGDDEDRVTYYLAGRLPDGESVVPGDLGMVQPPTGRQLSSALDR